jgi:hypothetical protein
MKVVIADHEFANEEEACAAVQIWVTASNCTMGRGEMQRIVGSYRKFIPLVQSDRLRKLMEERVAQLIARRMEDA